MTFTTMTLSEKKKMKQKVKPYDQLEVKNEKKAFSKTKKTVKPVAKDTNKTRRKMVKPTRGK